MALLTPLLIVLLLAVGYFGHAIASQQNLNVAARFAAREMAKESTQEPGDRTNGSYDATSDRLLELAQLGLAGMIRPDQLTIRSETLLHHDYNRFIDSGAEFVRLDEHRFMYRWTETIDATSTAYHAKQPRDRHNKPPANLGRLKVGVGALFYGGTLQYKLNELDPIARYIGLNSGVELKATSLMPAELPLRGSDYGLMDLNPWLADLLGENVENNENYPALIEE